MTDPLELAIARRDAELSLLRYLMKIAQDDGAAVWLALLSELYDKVSKKDMSRCE